MTADERALLAGVIAAPDDDLPRLVYADWLDENGRPERAELIRVQCGLAQTKDRADVAERSQWQSRQMALLREWSGRWRRELPQLAGLR